MTCTRHLVAMGLLAFSLQVNAADWGSSDITDIIDNVKAIFNEVTGDVADMAQDFKRQLASLKQKGDIVKDDVEDTLDSFQNRKTPFLDFVNGTSGRCGEGSPCLNFRADLEEFISRVAELKSRFPQIERHGLGDGEFLVNIIDIAPPAVLFGVYELLQRVPDWRDIPQNLSDLYDEIGDPDAFSLELPGARASAAVTVASAAVGPASVGSGFLLPLTPADTFCSKGRQPTWDPVRLNRLKAFFVMLKDGFDGVAEFVPDKKTVVVAGEGTSVKIPVQPALKAVAQAIDAILASVDAHRANLEQCKKVETDIAGCTPLVEYRSDAGNRKAYWVVTGIYLRLARQPGSNSTVTTALDRAIYLNGQQRYQDAYQKICDAYAAL